MGFNEEKYQKKIEKDQKHYDKKIYKTQKVKMYRLKHWIFDFGGVMVKGAQALNKVIVKMNQELGFTVSRSTPEARKWRRMLSSGRLTAEQFLQKLVKSSQPSDITEKIDVQPFLDYWFQVYSDLIQLSPEMEIVVERLHKAGYHVSLFSNTYDIHAKSNELKGFFDLFDDVFLSNELKMRKPDIEKYKYVLKTLNTKPKDTIFIPAKKLGMKVIRFVSFEQFRQYLDDLGIDEISQETQDRIKRHYKTYITTKKEYNKARKEVQSLKRKLKKLEKKGKMDVYSSLYKKLERELQYRSVLYQEKKNNFKKQKFIKKQILEPKLRITPEESQ